ncbi:hypothetical protein BI313_11100 [Xanthomonas vesicatoria]|nr:hypothetical protein BI313_11100 [Xanthomonas vesicatoria]
MEGPAFVPTSGTDLVFEVLRPCGNASACCGCLRAYRRGTRRKYVHVGSGAASMPLKVPRRHARKHHRLQPATEGKRGDWFAARALWLGTAGE